MFRKLGTLNHKVKPLHTRKSMEWTLPDIMDLEYFLEQDQNTQEQDALRKRDRTFYLDRILPQLEASDGPGKSDGRTLTPGKQVLLKWLELRRSQAEAGHKEQKLLPGSIYRETSPLILWLFFLGGVFLGITVVASFFSYAGSRPLNISYYLSLTLLGQLILLFLSMAGFLMAGTNGSSSRMPILQNLFGVFAHTLVGKIKEKSLTHIHRGHQDAMISALGLVRAKHRIYGSLFLWPLFILGQVFALGFNTGVLVTTLTRVVFSDTAFGWQSTLKVGPELVHGLVSVVALPWSWMFPAGVGVPTMEQISGSRMILKDGIYHLTTADLISWWPFLCLCVFFYGFLPRLVLVGVGQWMKKQSIAALSFDHASCQRLLSRMTTPFFSIDASIAPSRVFAPARETSTHKKRGAEAAHQGTVPCGRDKKPSHGLDSILPLNQSPLPKEKEKQGAPATGLEPKIKRKPKSPKKQTTDPIPDEGVHHPPSASSAPPPGSFSHRLHQTRGALVLISEDLADTLDLDELARQVFLHCGTSLVKHLIVGEDADAELKMIRAICHAPRDMTERNAPMSGKETAHALSSEGALDHRQEENPGVLSSVVWVLEAWQPPIKETLFFLKSLRRDLGDGMDLVVALVGKPTVHTVFTLPGAMDLSVWHKKIDALGDPWLRIETLEVLS